MRKIALLVLLALCLQVTAGANFTVLAQARKAAPAAARAPFKEELKQFDDFVAYQMKLDKTPGLTIGFMQGDFVWAKGYGFSDLENKVPAKAESAYRLASVSKSMTALAIMQLVEKKKIDLDAEVQTYVSYFPKKQWPVTVRQVMGHIGGISHYKNAIGNRDELRKWEPDRLPRSLVPTRDGNSACTSVLLCQSREVGGD